MNLVSRVCLYVRHEVECLRHVVHPSSKLGSYCFVLFMIVSCAVISILLIVFSFRSATDEVLAVRPGRDALSYAIVVDAGSSGSRGHLYKWPPHSGNPHHLLDLQPVTDIRGNAMLKTVTPGLSSLASRPEAALEYFRPILDFATAHIPLGKQKHTPIYVLATAGMRLLNVSTQQAILSSLTAGITENYSFIVGPNSVQVISGREEGVFQWIAANYALNRFRPPVAASHVTRVDTSSSRKVRRQSTVGVIDMGGASMQIAVEITNKQQLQSLRDATTRIDLGCMNFSDEHTFNIYVNTFLGYGANEMFQRHQRLLISNVTDVSLSVHDDCMIAGYKEKLQAPQSLCQSSSLLTSSLRFAPVVNTTEEPISRQRSSGNMTEEPLVRNGFSGNMTEKPPRRRRSAGNVTEELLVRKGFSGNMPEKPLRMRRSAGNMSEELPRRFSDGKCEVTVVGTGNWPGCESSLIQQIRAERTTRRCNVTSEHASRADECLTRVLSRPPQSVRFSELVGFSEFWYSTHDLLKLGGSYSYAKLREKASTYCSTQWAVLKRRYLRTTGRDSGAVGSQKIARHCFKSAYIAAALHEGLGIDQDFRGLTTSSNVLAGRVASWTIGALLYKLRFLPLSAVRQVIAVERAGNAGVSLRVFEEFSLHLVLGCVLIVAALTVLFAARLWRMRRRAKYRSSSSFGQSRPQTEEFHQLLSVASYR